MLTVQTGRALPEQGRCQDGKDNTADGRVVVCSQGRRLVYCKVKSCQNDVATQRLTSYAARNRLTLTLSGLEYAERAYSNAAPPTMPL